MIISHTLGIMILTEEKETKGDQEPGRSKKKLFLSLIFFIMLLFGLYSLWMFLQKPAVGIIQTEKMTSQEDFDQKNGTKYYRGEYFSFSSGAKYSEKIHTKGKSGPIKENILLSDQSIEGRKIAIIVANRGEDDLAADPSFQMRVGAPRVYTQKTINFPGWRGVIFEKNTSIFEETAFFYHAPYSVSISLTDLFKIDGLEDELLQILSTLKWGA